MRDDAGSLRSAPDRPTPTDPSTFRCARPSARPSGTVRRSCGRAARRARFRQAHPDDDAAGDGINILCRAAERDADQIFARVRTKCGMCRRRLQSLGNARARGDGHRRRQAARITSRANDGPEKSPVRIGYGLGEHFGHQHAGRVLDSLGAEHKRRIRCRAETRQAARADAARARRQNGIASEQPRPDRSVGQAAPDGRAARLRFASIGSRRPQA